MLITILDNLSMLLKNSISTTLFHGMVYTKLCPN